MDVGINYKNAIDNLNENAFQFCVENLYPLSGFKVLEPKDIRRIDLLEMVSRQVAYVEEGNPKYSDQGSLRYYIYLIDQYLRKILVCRNESRADKYKRRALEMINTINSSDDTAAIEDYLADIFITYISLLRDIGENEIFYANSMIIDDLSFDVEPDDAKLLKKVKDCWNITPHAICEKTKTGWMVTNETHRIMDFQYVFSILLLATILEERGMF